MAIRFTVSGRVQGVGFRWATRVEAERLGLTGAVRNLADGTVQVDADGDAAALDALREWLRRGPKYSKVTGLREQPIESPGVRGFGVDG